MASLSELGFGKTMEKKLHSVGIHSSEELKKIGSKQAVFRLKEQYPNTCVVILYYLEAAIRGVEIKQLDDTCKAELKAYFKQLSTINN
ncbi:MAG: TfoX/Sxy family DNA transformation protein [Oscillospiraceae bacterium]|nr:TfoX/Sxy family DNA transformation protein [Oscillospiraceae bacterium]